MKKLLIASLILGATSANAGIIRSAVDASATSEFSATYDIGNAIDQSGLSAGYVSGVDDFDTYIASNPIHSLIAANLEWFTAQGVQSASATFDLGAVYLMDAVAMWHEEAWGPSSDVSYSVSTDGVSFNTIASGISWPDYDTDYPATVYNFADVSSRYFRIDIGTCGQLGCSLGEIAFSTMAADIPEPLSLSILGLGLLGLGATRRKR